MKESEARWHEENGLTVSVERPALPGDGPQTIASILEPILRTHPDAPALVGRHGRYDYRSLDAEVARAAAALHDLGLRAPDRVAACLPNDVDIVVAFLASQRLGLVWVGINRVLAGAEKHGSLVCAVGLASGTQHAVHPSVTEVDTHLRSERISIGGGSLKIDPEPVAIAGFAQPDVGYPGLLGQRI